MAELRKLIAKELQPFLDLKRGSGKNETERRLAVGQYLERWISRRLGVTLVSEA